MDWYEEVWLVLPSFSCVAWKGVPAVPLLLVAVLAALLPKPPKPPPVEPPVDAPKPVLVEVLLLPNRPPPVVFAFELPKPPVEVLLFPKTDPVVFDVPNPPDVAGLLAPKSPTSCQLMSSAHVKALSEWITSA